MTKRQGTHEILGNATNPSLTLMAAKQNGEKANTGSRGLL